MDAGTSGEQQRRLAPARPEVIDEVVAGEAVIVHLGTGRYFALNAAATQLWAWVDGGCSLEDVGQLDGLPSGWDAATSTLFAGWVDEGLVVPAPGSTGPAGSPFDEAVQLGPAPEMRVFTDLEDLLLLDPIHDVELDADGFPVTRPTA